MDPNMPEDAQDYDSLHSTHDDIMEKAKELAEMLGLDVDFCG